MIIKSQGWRLKRKRVSLLFPPGWTLYSGGPHLALPGLRSVLEASGAEVQQIDLNIETVARYTKGPNLNDLALSCSVSSISVLNGVYFKDENRLNSVAGEYGGLWDLRLGFGYEDANFFSSRQSFFAIQRESPFTTYYRDIVVPRVMDYEPGVVAFSLACIQQMIPALELCKELKAAGSDAILVLGGNTVSRIADSITSGEIFRHVDALAVYQGEPVLPKLVESVAEGDGLGNVPSLIWWDGHQVRRNRIDNHVQANSLPTPNFDDLDLNAYWGEPFLPIIAARGCYHGKCDFCAIPHGWGRERFGGLRSPERVLDDIETLIARHGIRNFKFVDESMPPATIRRLSNLIIDRGLDIQWEAYTRLERAWVETDLAEVAAEAGFVKGYFGVELVTGNNRDSLGKNDTGDALGILKACEQSGILVHMFSMLGFPGTTVEDARRTIQFAMDNVERIDTLDVFAYGYARGTPEPPGVRVVRDPDLDWALEYPYEAESDECLSSREVEEMVTFYEEFIFERYPALLHPVPRLLTPWVRLDDLSSKEESESLRLVEAGR